MKVGAIDKALMGKLQFVQKDKLTPFFRILTASGTGKAWFGGAGLIWLLSNQGIHLLSDQWIFLRAMIAGLFAWALGHLLKKLTKRPRPYEALPEIRVPIRPPFSKDSFPSNHSAAAFALTTSLFLVGSPAWKFVALWACLVSFSRYYLGAHYPSDILGGTTLGLVCGYVNWSFLLT